MNLAGAIKFEENVSTILYTMNSPQTGQYAVVVPKDSSLDYVMVVDTNMKTEFDLLMKNSISKEALITKINEKYNYVVNKYKGAIFVMPMLDVNDLVNAINSGDNSKMMAETQKIGAITSEIYAKLTENGIAKDKINQKINILECNDNDVKFVSWLKGQMPNFVDAISFNNVSNNPFMSDVKAERSNDIFASSSALVDVQTQNVEKPFASANVSNDIFENKGALENVNLGNSANSVSNNDIFGGSNSNNIPAGMQNVTSSNEATLGSGVNENPFGTPVNSVSNDVNADNTTFDSLSKKSGGFANLLILLVVLVAVTVISIELGKFLYTTYGA